ncbi:MAG: YcxB family protein [Firmicutes bacterium]|nr:YcxB family protein [Bacillota bacterium]MBR2575999.1 YcxB family protein [Bacillota bacterium]
MADVRRLEFDVQLEKKDYKNLVYNNIMGKNKFAIFGMFGVLIISIGYLVLGAAGVIQMTDILKLVAVALIVAVLGMLAFMRYITNRLQKSDFAYMGSKRHMIFSEDGVVSEAFDEEKSKEFEWENLYNGEECRTHFLIFNTAGMIVLVPKRFLTEKQIPQLRKIIKVMMQSKFKTKYKID